MISDWFWSYYSLNEGVFPLETGIRVAIIAAVITLVVSLWREWMGSYLNWDDVAHAIGVSLVAFLLAGMIAVWLPGVLGAIFWAVLL